MLVLPENRRAHGQRSALIINAMIHVIYLLLLPVWYFLSMFSAMLFDSPGSDHYWPLILFYLTLNGYPILAAIAIIAAWIIYRKKYYNWTYVVTMTPIMLILLTGIILFGFGD